MVSTVPESINCKANQKARHWDGAACIAEEGEEEVLDNRAKVMCQ